MDITTRHSAEVDQILGALAAAQAEMNGAKKDATNPHFKSKYADLESTWDACRGPLTKHGIAVIQMPSADGPKVTVTTMLGHKSGQWIASDLSMVAQQNTPQGVGSAITYGRRYGLASMAGIAPEDDDGQAASEKQPKAESKPEPKVATKPKQDTPTKEQIKAEMVRNIESYRTFTGKQYDVILSAHSMKSAADVPSSAVGKQVLALLEDASKQAAGVA